MGIEEKCLEERDEEKKFLEEYYVDGKRLFRRSVPYLRPLEQNSFDEPGSSQNIVNNNKGTIM